MIKREDGLSLIELIVTITIIGILVAALSTQFTGWRKAYKVESQLKELQMDLMDTRAKAMQRNRMHFARLDTDGYQVHEDTNPAPDGNNTLDVGSDALILDKELSEGYPITWSGGDNELDFLQSGMSDIDGSKTICINDNDPTDNDEHYFDADYNCIVVTATRINLGKLGEKYSVLGPSACSEDNCAAK